jgi:AraC family transcriptional regulator
MIQDVRHWPGMRSEYNWLPASEGATRTKPNQVGVAFSRHRAAVYDLGGRTVEADIAPGQVFVTGHESITWRRVTETTEALEIYPDPALIRSLAPTAEVLPAGGQDGTVLAIASILRRAHLVGLGDVAASTLAHRLAVHLVEQYGGVRLSRHHGLLDRRTVDQVTAYVEAHLAETLTVERLAAVALLSPFHFARSFKATTGLAPHQFVTARRVQRATVLLTGTTLSVTAVAHAVGMTNVSHFRRVFRRQTGALPVELRNFGPSCPSGSDENIALWKQPPT